MNSLRHLYFLIRTQILYSWWVISAAIVVCSMVGLVGSLLISDSRQLGKVWAMAIFIPGVISSLFLWARDVQERRTLGWLQLPLSPSAMVTARLVLPLIVHALLLIPFVACLIFWLGQPEMYSPAMLQKVFGLHAFSLVVAFLVQLSEELTVLIYRWGTVGVLAAHIALAAAIVVFSIYSERFGLPDADSLPGIVLLYSGAMVAGLLTARLYLRRSNYLIGVDACTSMPVDWSKSAD